MAETRNVERGSARGGSATRVRGVVACDGSATRVRGLCRGVVACAAASWLAASPQPAAAQEGAAPPGGGGEPAATEVKPEDPPLSPAPEGTWGVGGKEEEGRFEPKGKTGKLKEEPRDPEDDKPARLGPPGEVWVDTVVGFGEIRDVLNDGGATEMTSISFVAGFAYRIGETWMVGARVPFSRASVAGPQEGTRDDYSATQIGNVELTVRSSFRLTRRLYLPAWISIYVPSAPGDPFTPIDDNVGRAEALVNQAAQAARGWEENALFASKRFGVTPGVGLTYDSGPIHAMLGTRLEIMVRAGGNDPYAPNGNPPVPELRGVATNWVTSGSGFYDFLGGKVSPGLRAWLAFNTAPIAYGTADYSGAQLVVEPSVEGKLPLNDAGTLAVRGVLGYLLPLGGHLGGADEASVSGLRLRASLLF